jgi:hypothetical protein
MFGFVFGTLCLLGLFVVLRRGRRHRGWYGPGRRYAALRAALDRLDTTPGQEKIIRDALHQLGEHAREARREVLDTRADVARALESSELDAPLLHGVFQRHDASLEKLRSSALGALRTIHETLDERQRRTLAKWVGSAPWGFHHRAESC